MTNKREGKGKVQVKRAECKRLAKSKRRRGKRNYMGTRGRSRGTKSTCECR